METMRRQSATSAAIEQLRLKRAESKKHRGHLSPALLIKNSEKRFTKKDLEAACRKVGAGSGSAGAVSPVAGSACSSPSSPLQGRHPSKKQQLKPSPSVASNCKNNTDSDSQVRALDNSVKLCARKYNDCKAQADKLEKELQSKIDEHDSLTTEAAALEDMIAGNNPEARKLSTLAQDIEEANAGADAKLHYRLQLHHMHQRLRKNSVSLDKHLGAMSDTVASARREQEQCEKMLGEVEAGFSDAMRTLEATARFIEVERDERSRTLTAKRAEAKNSAMLETWRNERESSRQELEQSLGGSMRQEQDALKERIKERQRELKVLNREVGTKASECGIVDETVTRIMQATGLNNLEDVVKELRHHKQHRDKLLAEQSDAEKRLKEARDASQVVNASNDQNQARGYGDTEFNRDVQDELHESISCEQTQGKVVKSTNVRLEAVLVGLRQGGMGLYQKVLPFHPTLLDCEPPTLSDSSSASPIQAAYETLEILKVAALILGKMLDAVGGIDKVINESNTAKDGTRGDEVDVLENLNLGEINCRIETEAETGSPHDSGTYVVDAVEGLHGDVRPQSRGTMKAISASQVEEARRQDDAVRQRALPNGAAAAAASSLASSQREAQLAAMERISKASSPVGLPEGLSIRSSPMQKAQVLLSTKPPLD